MALCLGGGMLAELRIHALSSGEDLVVLATDQHVEAPNWTPDGRWLVVNCAGRIYRIASTGGPLELVDTTPLDRLNNDHVLSPDGQTLYVSSSGDGHLYALPLAGGRPLRVSNDRGPDFTHYLHGVSPDGATLAYVGVEPYQGVAGAYRNIFTLPSAGGTDRRLTDTPAAADGPEFSPDGKWIYFNSEHRRRRAGGAGTRADLPDAARRHRAHPADGRRAGQLVPAPVARRTPRPVRQLSAGDRGTPGRPGRDPAGHGPRGRFSA